MFDLFRKKPKAQESQNAPLQLLDKDKHPMTYAVVLKSGGIMKDTEKWLDNSGINIKKAPDPNEIAGHVQSAWGVLVVDIALSAANQQDRIKFDPSEPIELRDCLPIAYALSIGVILAVYLKDEGFEISLQEIAVSLSRTMFVLWDQEAQIEAATKGIGLFKKITAAKDKEIKDWHDRLSKLVTVYVFSNMSDLEEDKEKTIKDAFGPMLESLYKAGVN